ncbi:MAG TPA: MFS transporter [Victivallales bacterium]|nr:MFS transporter [Victivallales bacterium]
MNRKELKIITFSSGGQIIEFYDFLIFIYFSGAISMHFFEGSQYARYLYVFGVFALGYLIRPIGGIFFGHFGDKIGRKKVFLASIFLISISTFLMGFIPSYALMGIISPIIFIFLRMVQGFSLGGELSGASTYVYECMDSKRKVFGTSFIFSALYLGTLIASVLVTILLSIYTAKALANSFAWRIPFIIGGILGFIIGMFRYSLLETGTFEKLLKEHKTVKFPFLVLMKSSYKKVILGVFIYFYVFLSTVLTIVLPDVLPVFLHEYKAETTLKINSYILLVLIILIPVSGYLISKYKLNKFLCFSISSILLCISSFFIFSLIQTDKVELLFCAYLIFAVIDSVAEATALAIIIDLFKPNIRYSGVALVANIGSILIIGIVPSIIIYMIRQTGNLYNITYLAVIITAIPAVTGLYLYYKNRKQYTDSYIDSNIA